MKVFCTTGSDICVTVHIPDIKPSSRRVPRLAIREASRQCGRIIIFAGQKDMHYRKRTGIARGCWDIWIDRKTLNKPSKLLCIYID